MAYVTPRMSLTVWNNTTDPYDHEQLANNFLKLDLHDHSQGRGTAIPGAGIQPYAISSDHIYPGSLTTLALADGSVTTPKIADLAVTPAKLSATAYAPEVSSLPGSPVDQQECIFVADATNGVKWHLRYRAASASIYKWEFIGGPPLASEVVTLETTASTTYVDLTTVGPSVTLPLAGDWTIGVGADVLNATVGATQVVSPKLGAAATSDTDASLNTSATASAEHYGLRVMRRNGLAASALIKVQYRVSAGTGNFQRRYLEVRPVRVG